MMVEFAYGAVAACMFVAQLALEARRRDMLIILSKPWWPDVLVALFLGAVWPLTFTVMLFFKLGKE